MADILSEEEIEAIAAYDGPVQYIRRGKSGIPLDSVSWMEGNRRYYHKVMREKKFVLSRERDEIIREMHAEGKTISDMARATGLTRKSVKARLERMKLV